MLLISILCRRGGKLGLQIFKLSLELFIFYAQLGYFSVIRLTLNLWLSGICFKLTLKLLIFFFKIDYGNVVLLLFCHKFILKLFDLSKELLFILRWLRLLDGLLRCLSLFLLKLLLGLSELCLIIIALLSQLLHSFFQLDCLQLKDVLLGSKFILILLELLHLLFFKVGYLAFKASHTLILVSYASLKTSFLYFCLL